MRVAITRVAATSIIDVDGGIDVDTAHDVYQAAVREAEAGSTQIVLDLSGIDHIDSVGLGALTRSQDELATRLASTVTLHDPSRRVQSMLESTSTAERFVIMSDDATGPTVADDDRLQRANGAERQP